MKRNGLLKNMTELAAALGITTTFIKRMKYAGFEMPGGVSTEAWALRWLKEHPGFRQKDFLRPPRRQEPHPNGEHRAEKDADKLREQCH
jgi:hypothetical protein